MAIRKLDRSQWAAYFDGFSRRLIRERRTDYAEMRLLSDELGNQPEAGWLPLHGVTYDAKGDLLEVLVQHRDRLIFHPAEIYVDELDGEVLGSFEVILADGTREIVQLR